MGPLKNFSQISSNLNKLQQNIFSVGFDESILKVGQELKIKRKSRDRKAKRGMSSEEEFDEFQSEEETIDKKMRSSHKEKDFVGMKPFYSPRQKSTEHMQQYGPNWEADLGYGLETGSCGKNTDTSGQEESKGVLDEIGDHLDTEKKAT
jgi:hypothetical protein